MSALQANTNGTYNSAYGTSALYSNTTGNDNTASGDQALWNNTRRERKYRGRDELYASQHGQQQHRSRLPGGGGVSLPETTKLKSATPGRQPTRTTIRIGAQGTQTVTYVAGVAGVNVTGGTEVVVNSSGKLGVVLSSARYKHDITDVGARSDGLMKLRPVTFRYNNDPAGTLQYGLVAEEVAKVYPELVVYGPDGKPMTVRYSMLSAMLLNQLQKQTTELRKISIQMARDKAATESRIAELEASHRRDLRAIQAGFERRLSAIEHARDGASPMPVNF